VTTTHQTPVVNVQREGVETGIHPDFFRNTEHEKHVRELLTLYPAAKGVRAHGLFEYSGLLETYRRCGLQWDSSQLLYLCPNITPYRHPSGLVRLPIFWEDDDYFGQSPDWKVSSLGLDRPGVKCFDFHPIHLRLNTHTAEQYRHAKEGSFSEAAIQEATYSGNDKGTLGLFFRLCEWLQAQDAKVLTMGEVIAWV
jgi:hypothetical protein